MSYFPAFLKMDAKKVLIVGGGYIAYEKLKHLLDFTGTISVIAIEFNSQMQSCIDQYALEYEQRAYESGDINGFDIVVVAVDDIALQAEIYKESRSCNTLCNAVDATEYCDFIFPSYIKKGDLTVAVSTSGASPAMSKHLRHYLEELIPDSIESFLVQMRTLRKKIPKGKDRMKMFDEKVKKYIQSWSK
jgi:precorrin-2 dehydrogenase/sirohydrochlorin ferrochelatase